MSGRDTRRAAVYGRTSTKDQNLETQLAPVREFVDRAGWTIHREFTDFGYSGQHVSRPGLDALLADARARRFQVLVTWKLDRLGRSLSHLVGILDELRGLGVDFVATSQAIDTTTPSGKLMLHMLGAIAEFERELIRERVIAGLERAKREGKILGRPPRADRDEIARQLAKGKSLGEIAKELGLAKGTIAYHAKLIREIEA